MKTKFLHTYKLKKVHFASVRILKSSPKFIFPADDPQFSACNVITLLQEPCTCGPAIYILLHANLGSIGFASRSESLSNWRQWCSNASTGLHISWRETSRRHTKPQTATLSCIIFTRHSSYTFYSWWSRLRRRSCLCLEQASPRNQICHITTWFQTDWKLILRLRLTLVKWLKFL